MRVYEQTHSSTTGDNLTSGLYCQCGHKMVYSLKYDRWYCPVCSDGKEN